MNCHANHTINLTLLTGNILKCHFKHPKVFKGYNFLLSREDTFFEKIEWW